jgi:excisionase family DNA binding protein
MRSVGQTKETLLTARQIADLLQVHITTVRRWSRSGELTSYRLGSRGHRRYTAKDVDVFLGKQNGSGIST